VKFGSLQAELDAVEALFVGSLVILEQDRAVNFWTSTVSVLVKPLTCSMIVPL
jgi:hypothetical protein